MKKSLGSLLVGALLTVATVAQASDDITQPLEAKITSTLGISVDKIVPSPVDGLFQVYSDKGILYVSADGSKMLHGTMYDLDNRMANLTDAAMGEVRKSQLASIEGTTIDFKAKDEKYVVTVFTDITCGYCRKLHNSIDEYNDLGITVRYLAYPRNGRNAQSWQDMEQIWCAEDQQQALTNGKANIANSGSASCDAAKSVGKHYSLGGSFGVTGTPAIVTADGGLIPGYMPPQKLLQSLQQG
ncbi:bifunctional protein-disulfide isomerase/oxidoreductase DsbC [uncultured Ferrimonas sp.]|uniref:bifunctional protein-disulfide isomerase/oxidoreductase DsbC n=1 Tax=uncultured Ferrimonas sp. TaxID=432640 RepID=UPI002614130B|nr:bifunctional protein-disulfide isomerase/oxidoreductase DsbC [uncultured Ferrimonas sp.]